MNAPEHLSPEEADVWDKTVVLVPIMTKQREAVLEAYSIERARWMRADAWLREHGEVITLRSDKGEVKSLIPAPQLRVAQVSQDRVIKLGKELQLDRV